MEPDIRYATTADGVSIAYWTMGDGEPLLMLQPPPFNDIEREWHEWEFHRLVAQHRQLIRYDCRGSGSSQRSVEDFSLDALVSDVEAVVDTLGLERFNMWGEVWCATTAIGYAARHPERIAHLVLYAPIARPAEFFALPTVRSLQSLLDQDDWRTYTDAIALAFLGWDEASAARDIAAFYRGCTDMATAKCCIAAQQSIDVTGLLGRVSTPSLIVYPRGGTFPTIEMARRLASGIANARLSIVESAGYWNDESTNAVLRLLDEFLEEKVRGANPPPSLVSAAPPAPKFALATILFTDIVGHTEMMQRLGDAKGRDVLRDHERITREALAASGGVEVKTDGDSFMASFASVSSAVECAIALQRAFAEHSASADEPIVVRMGLHAGEPIAEGDDLFGSSVILASRIEAQAAGGEILVSDVVRSLVSGKSFLFTDRGEFAMKGFDEAVRLYEVRWRE